MPNILLALFSAHLWCLLKQSSMMVNSYTYILRSIKKLNKADAVRLIISFKLAYSWDMWHQ
ncbi:Uncharacterised protein [Klebsiella pneumoniae]|nr:hypothetical protein [Klebsiella pneumoniae subsp. pneumoniae]CEL86632.1 hypothetical protein KVR801_340077 [Klebsiella variicola]SAW36033.1 Uncharacterised protein [Klebsiella pneumoniae]NQE15805.1 hypothetical protein [Klebsiella pneumoniae subsp. pneumoniae]NQE23643.1 hypothetical protein [Klebsiella pneumoniae subsp. pneumoniae]